MSGKEFWNFLFPSCSPDSCVQIKKQVVTFCTPAISYLTVGFKQESKSLFLCHTCFALENRKTNHWTLLRPHKMANQVNQNKALHFVAQLILTDGWFPIDKRAFSHLTTNSKQTTKIQCIWLISCFSLDSLVQTWTDKQFTLFRSTAFPHITAGFKHVRHRSHWILFSSYSLYIC